MNITRKRLFLIPEERNSQEKINAWDVYASDIVRFPKENIVFLEETGFNLHTHSKYGYSPLNSKAFLNLQLIKMQKEA